MESSLVAIIKPGLLIDGLGGAPQKGAAVVLQEIRIRWIGPNEEIGTDQEIKDLVASTGENGVLDLP